MNKIAIAAVGIIGLVLFIEYKAWNKVGENNIVTQRNWIKQFLGAEDKGFSDRLTEREVQVVYIFWNKPKDQWQNLNQSLRDEYAVINDKYGM